MTGTCFFGGGFRVRFSVLVLISCPASGDLALPGWLKSNRSFKPGLPAAPARLLIGCPAACEPAVAGRAAASAQPISLFGLL